jgi:hypothetical protein
MTASIKLDIIDGGNLKYSADGYELDRIAIVSGLSGTASSKFISALSVSGMPDLGDPHPSMSAAILREISVESISQASNEVRVLLKYSTFVKGSTQYPQYSNVVRCGSAVQQEQTTQGIENSSIVDIYTRYTYPDDANKYGDMAGKTDDQGGYVPKLVPLTSVTLSMVQAINGVNLTALSKWYTGKVNSGGFPGIDPTAVARTWLCTEISGDSNDGGNTYNVTYSFQYKPDTWDATVVFNDFTTGKPPITGDLSQAIKTYQIYEEVDFNMFT